MNEIEILYETTVSNNELLSFLFAVSLIVGIICGAAASIMSFDKLGRDESEYIGTIVVFIVCIAIAITSVLNNPKVKQYEVKLTNDYILDAQKYKIVNQRGDIITIKEILQKESGK